ncbi:MAG: RHS repeat-associated core domain-containing protein, partial [Rubricella sp.]
PETITATGPGGRLLQDLRLAFDPVGNPVMSEDAAQAPGAAGSPVTGLAVSARRLFTHDAYYRLASASGRVHRALQIQDYRNGLDDGAATKSTRHITLDNGAEIDAYTRTYTYDDGDNLTRIHHAGDTLTWTRDIWVSATSNRSLPAVDLNGIALVAPEAAFDAGGNVTRMPHLEAMEWNWQGRLARAVIIGRGGPGLDDAEVSVYGTGRQRLRRIVERRVGGAMELAETIFLPGCTLRRVRREGEAPTLARSTLEVEASGLTVARIHQWTADATGRETDSIAEKRIRLLLHDHLGSVSTELDETGGVATYEEYFAFGGTAFIAGRDRRDVTIKENRFAGGLRDDATGFYCFEHRHYAPFIGNWISPDPAGTVDGLNLYRYARNNPVLFVDPSGLESIVNWPDETPRAVRQAAFDPSDTARATFTAFVDTITVEINGQTWSTTATVTARRNERGDFVRWWATFELEAPVAPPDESGGANQQGGGQQSGQGQQPARPPQRDDDEADGPGGSGGTGTDGDGPGAGEDGTGTGADGDDDETTPGQPGTGEGNREGPGRGDGETGDTTGQDGTGNTPGQNGTGDTPGQGGDGETPGQNGTGDEPGTGGSGEGGGGTGQRSSAERRSEEAPSPPEGYPTSEDGVPYSPDLDLPPPEEIPPDAEFTTDPNAVSPGRGADSQGDPRGTPEGEAPNTRPGGQGGQGGPEGSANGSSDGDPRNSEGKRGLKGGMGTHELPEWLGWVDPALDWVQTGLDIVGLIPGLGEIADGINGLISLARGDYLGASLSFAAMIPFAGWAATAGKFGRRAVNAADAMSDAGGAILRHGDEAAEAAAAARRRAAGLPDDDPLIDNNILSWLHSGQSQAVDFAERYRGLVSIDRTVAREFMRGGRSAHELHGLMRRFDITLLPRVDAATLAPDLAHVLASRGGTVARNDDVIVATARHFGLRFASGDQRAVISALRSGVDARYFNFGPYSIRQRYGRMITRLRGNGFNPRDVLGPLNPWP